MRVARNAEVCVARNGILYAPLTAKIFDVKYRFYFT